MLNCPPCCRCQASLGAGVQAALEPARLRLGVAAAVLAATIAALTLVYWSWYLYLRLTKAEQDLPREREGARLLVDDSYGYEFGPSASERDEQLELELTLGPHAAASASARPAGGTRSTLPAATGDPWLDFES